MFTGTSSDIPEKCQIEFKSTPRKSARKPQKIKMLWAGSRHSAGQIIKNTQFQKCIFFKKGCRNANAVKPASQGKILTPDDLIQ